MSGPVFSLGQSREGRKHWSLELRELVWRRATQRLSQENKSLPLVLPGGVREDVEDFPLDIG